jgi:hypothetical protein
MRALLFGGVLLMTLGACSLAFSLDGYEGTKKDGGPTTIIGPDGALIVVNPGSSSSGSTSGNTSSSGIVPNPDGGFCPTGAVFCDDFERSDQTDIVGKWDSFNPTGGTGSLIGGQPTNIALRIQIDPNSDDSIYSTVDLVKNIPASPTKASITSRLFLTTVSAIHGMHFNVLVFSRGQGKSSTIFPYFNGSNNLTVGELECDPSITGGCSYSQATVAKTLSLGAWHDIAFSVDFTVTPARLTLVVDSAVAIQESADPHAATGAMQAQAGAAYLDGSHTAWDFMIDNVVLTAQ